MEAVAHLLYFAATASTTPTPGVFPDNMLHLPVAGATALGSSSRTAIGVEVPDCIPSFQ
jgi:hypothetical protein